MDFPAYASFTITSACNLRCSMCGQWSEEGYMHDQKANSNLQLADWIRLGDEVADHKRDFVLLRGGEPFMFPGIIELLEHLTSRGLFVAIDTNGTLLKRYAADLVRIGNIHVTISVDGTEEVHDQVRGVKGCFQRIRESVAALAEMEKTGAHKVSRSVNFTISPWSLSGLGNLPDIARGLGITSLSIVPYYYVPEDLGKAYEDELREEFGCKAFSWRGFHHDTSGIEFADFLRQYRQFKAGLGEIQEYPYMPLTEDEYRAWFESPTAPVGPMPCANVERLIDIQPQGDANFCVDFPDYVIGNVKDTTIGALWNSERAENFRVARRRQRFGACHRCGAKYMGEPRG